MRPTVWSRYAGGASAAAERGLFMGYSCGMPAVGRQSRI
jgi:hypothetical protein